MVWSCHVAAKRSLNHVWSWCYDRSAFQSTRRLLLSWNRVAGIHPTKLNLSSSRYSDRRTLQHVSRKIHSICMSNDTPCKWIMNSNVCRSWRKFMKITFVLLIFRILYFNILLYLLIWQFLFHIKNLYTILQIIPLSTLYQKCVK